MTTGTNTALMRSAKRCTGALEPCASSTSLTICASAVSAPTFVARNRKLPSLFMVAPMTVSPTFFSTGIDSPVSMDSSTAEGPRCTHAVDRDLLARTHDDDVADDDLLDRDVDLLAAAHDARGLGRQAHELLDRVGRAALRARLEQLAEEHERDEQRARSRRRPARIASAGTNVAATRVEVRRRRADGDERVHVAGAALERVPEAAVELRAGDELHRRGEQRT